MRQLEPGPPGVMDFGGGGGGVLSSVFAPGRRSALSSRWLTFGCNGIGQCGHKQKDVTYLVRVWFIRLWLALPLCAEGREKVDSTAQSPSRAGGLCIPVRVRIVSGGELLREVP